MAMFSDAVINLFFNSSKALKDIENFKTKTNSAFSDVAKGVMTGAAGIATAYFGVQALKNVYKNQMSIIDLSDKWNRSSESVSRFANTLSMFGGNTQEAAADIEHLETALMELRTTGGGALKSVANKMRLKVQKEDGSFLTSLELIEKIREEIKGLDNSGKIKALSEMGLTSPATIRMLSASQKEYDEMRKKAGDFGVINEQSAKKLKEVQRTLSALSQSFTSLSGEIVIAFKPLIDSITWVMRQFMFLPKAIRKIISIVGIIAGILGYFGKLGFVISKIGVVFSWIVKLLLFIKVVIVTIVGAVGGVVIAIVAAIAAIGYVIYRYWNDIKKFFSDLWVSFVSSGKRAANQLSKFWDFLTNIDLSGTWKAITEFFDKMFDYVYNGFVDAIKSSIESLGRVGRFAARIFGLGGDDTKSAPEMQNREFYSAGTNGTYSNQSNTTNNKNNNITIENITVSTADGADFGEKFLNTINTQTATGLKY